MATLATATRTPPPQTGFRRFWRTLKQLFHELTGAMFAVLAFSWLSSAFRLWTRDVAHWLLVIPIAVAALFIFFAVTSFQRSRRV